MPHQRDESGRLHEPKPTSVGAPNSRVWQCPEFSVFCPTSTLSTQHRASTAPSRPSPPALCEHSPSPGPLHPAPCQQSRFWPCAASSDSWMWHRCSRPKVWHRCSRPKVWTLPHLTHRCGTGAAGLRGGRQAATQPVGCWRTGVSGGRRGATCAV
eukprot:366425-Chlamydomonas_euryale.AAC.1